MGTRTAVAVARLGDQRVAVAIFVAGLAVTVASSLAFAAEASDDQRAELDRLALQARAAIERRVASYAEPLYGMGAILGGPEPAGRAEFRRYVGQAGTARRQPGLLAYTFNRRIAGGAEAEFERAVRGDNSLVPEGYPAFRVHPDGAAGAEGMVIDYVEPTTGNELIFGFDVASDPVRWRAVETARDGGRLVATQPVALVQEGGGSGFLLYLPVYATTEPPATAPARRRHFVGVVTAAVRLDQMLVGVLGRSPRERPRIAIQIREVGPMLGSDTSSRAGTRVLFESDGSNGDKAGPSPGRSRSTDLNVGGRRWRLFATPAAGFEDGQATMLPRFVGAAGAALSALLAGLLASLSGSKRRAVALAAGMTASLRRQEDELRTANLHLAESNAALARADRAKDEFLGTMSHELRTPLAAILGFARLLEARWQRLDPEERRESLTRIVRSATTLGGLVDDLLAFNRTGDHAPDLVLEVVDLAALAGEVVDGLGPVTTTHLVRLEAGETVVMADRVALARVITNLVTNAVKFSPPGTTVTVSTGDDGTTATLEVADEGPGVPVEERDLVFERFYRAGQAGVARRPGTGIGLAVVKDLVGRLGGSVRIVDAPTGGARFRVEVPTAAVPRPVDDAGATAERKRAALRREAVQ